MNAEEKENTEHKEDQECKGEGGRFFDQGEPHLCFKYIATYSFNKDVLSAYHVLQPGDVVVNRQIRSFPSWGFLSDGQSGQ